MARRAKIETMLEETEGPDGLDRPDGPLKRSAKGLSILGTMTRPASALASTILRPYRLSQTLRELTPLMELMPSKVAMSPRRSRRQSRRQSTRGSTRGSSETRPPPSHHQHDGRCSLQNGREENGEITSHLVEALEITRLLLLSRICEDILADRIRGVRRG